MNGRIRLSIAEALLRFRLVKSEGLNPMLCWSNAFQITVRFAALGAVFTAIGCAEYKDDFHPDAPKPPGFEQRLTPEERRQLAPNPLFSEVLARDPGAVLNRVRVDPRLLNSTNERSGDRPLGLAIKLADRETASVLARAIDYEDIAFRNLVGEGYVYLAAKFGMPEVIQILGEKKYARDRIFSFSTIDEAALDGTKALHVAYDRRAAQMLQHYYYKGIASAPAWSFMMHVDRKGRNFIHSAAVDGREDVLLWAAESLCGYSQSERNPESWAITQTARWALTRGLRAFQINVGDLGLHFDLLFNRKDSEGNAALHLAAQSRSERSIRALARCEWLDYMRASDGANDLPIQSFLKAMDLRQGRVSDEQRRAFAFLFAQETRLRWQWRARYVNHQNSDGNSALHLAARLADRYFYDLLYPVGDAHALNRRGQSAREIFDARRTELGSQ